jgi:hypothetical protein
MGHVSTVHASRSSGGALAQIRSFAGRLGASGEPAAAGARCDALGA